MEDGNTMTDNQLHTSIRIFPKAFDTITLSVLILACIAYLIFVGDRGGEAGSFCFHLFLVYFIICMIRIWSQRVSVDSCNLKYYILGLIPVELYWYDVSQIGIVHVYRSSGHLLLGEMFVVVLKPCEKYEEGFRKLRWWHIRPKWRHPFLVKNIYCDTGKYKEIIEEYSHKKVSFEIEYS